MNKARRQTLLLAAAAWATGSAATAEAQATGQVVASFSILADMARQLVPRGVEVSSLVGADSDAHVYEPKPADGRRLSRADLVLINGLGFEGWIERMVQVSGYRGTVVVASRTVRARQTAGGTDPHAWQDLALARQYASHLGSEIARRWPDRRVEIEGNTAGYLARLDQLDRQVREWLGAIPRRQRRVITSHDAFGYFGAAYGVDFLAPQGWNTHSEPSAAAVARLIRQIRQEGIRAVFVENISDPRLVERIAQEGQVRVGGTLYSDALSKAGGPADTYLRMMEHNARSLADALRA